MVGQNGVVRARMSGDMPGAEMFGGRVVTARSPGCGLIIDDKDIIERGGYVSFDDENAMSSLDSNNVWSPT